jgi:hypothetical protein
MLAPSVLDQSLQELEQSDWGEADTGETSLIQDCLRLHRIPIRDLTVHDLVTLVGQKIGLPWLVPLALERLRKEPLTEGFYYPGDLLHAVLTAESSFWGNHPQWRAEIRDIAQCTLTRLHSLTPEEEDYSDVVIRALTEGWSVFESAPHPA